LSTDLAGSSIFQVGVVARASSLRVVTQGSFRGHWREPNSGCEGDWEEDRGRVWHAISGGREGLERANSAQ